MLTNSGSETKKAAENKQPSGKIATKDKRYFYSNGEVDTSLSSESKMKKLQKRKKEMRPRIENGSSSDLSSSSEESSAYSDSDSNSGVESSHLVDEVSQGAEKSHKTSISPQVRGRPQWPLATKEKRIM